MKDKRKCKNPIICKLVTPVDQRGRSMLLTLNLATKRSSNIKQLNIWQTLQSYKIIKLERKQKRNNIITYNISQPPKRAKTQRRWWTGNSINQLFPSKLFNHKTNSGISTIMKDKRKCKNPIICKIS